MLKYWFLEGNVTQTVLLPRLINSIINSSLQPWITRTLDCSQVHYIEVISTSILLSYRRMAIDTIEHLSEMKISFSAVDLIFLLDWIGAVV